jgi:hypothetical protein
VFVPGIAEPYQRDLATKRHKKDSHKKAQKATKKIGPSSIALL